MSQEAVHFELIDYSQKQQKVKEYKNTNILEISNVTMEFTSCKDMTTVININHSWL